MLTDCLAGWLDEWMGAGWLAGWLDSQQVLLAY
jgi:hypothetical protein